MSVEEEDKDVIVVKEKAEGSSVMEAEGLSVKEVVGMSTSVNTQSFFGLW